MGEEQEVGDGGEGALYRAERAQVRNSGVSPVVCYVLLRALSGATTSESTNRRPIISLLRMPTTTTTTTTMSERARGYFATHQFGSASLARSVPLHGRVRVSACVRACVCVSGGALSPDAGAWTIVRYKSTNGVDFASGRFTAFTGVRGQVGWLPQASGHRKVMGLSLVVSRARRTKRSVSHNGTERQTQTSRTIATHTRIHTGG